jgi:hypothetical protein
MTDVVIPGIKPRAVLCTLAAMSGTKSESAEIPPTAPPTPLAKFVVAESRAGEFFVRIKEGEVVRLWFISMTAPSARIPAAAPRTKTWSYLVPFRSHDVRPGDEIVSIQGRPVAGMTASEALRALRSASDEPARSVEVRASGAAELRRALVVPQNAVTLGARVPRAR